MSGRARFISLALALLAATSSVLADDPSVDDSGIDSPNESPGNDSCRHLDAAVRWYGILYLFSGNEYMALNDDGNESYVADIADWDYLPADIDAAFQWSGDHAYYFMKGEDYYKYVITSLFGPWSATDYWDPYFQGGIDAAANRRGETYFFKGSTFVTWYNGYYGISNVNQIPSPLPHDIHAAFDKHDSWETMVVVKGDMMWEWGPGQDEIYGPFAVSDYYTLRSWTLCPLTQSVAVETTDDQRS